MIVLIKITAFKVPILFVRFFFLISYVYRTSISLCLPIPASGISSAYELDNKLTSTFTNLHIHNEHHRVVKIIPE